MAEGTSMAAQKQLGVGEQTGKSIGKGAAWLFGTDAVQGHIKDETKKNLRSQTQFPPKWLFHKYWSSINKIVHINIWSI